MLLITGMFCAVPVWGANNAADGDGAITVSPGQTLQGSVSNVFTFSWRNTNVGKFYDGSQCTILFPAGWTPPQTNSPGCPGYIELTTVQKATAAISSVSGNGPWTVTIDFTANQNGHGFDLKYAGGGNRVTAPAEAGRYTFVTKTKQNGGTLAEIAASPVIVVQDPAGGNPGNRLETFDHFTYTGAAYASGTFLGQDGSVWTYARTRGDSSIEGRSPTLEKSRGACIRSGTIPGGVGTLALKYRKAGQQRLNCSIFVNDTLAGTLSDGSGDIQTWTSGVLNIEGDVVLLFTNSSSSGAVTLDDVSWTGYSGAPAAFTLKVQSACGFSEPAAGDHVYLPGATITNTVQSPYMDGTTQYTCLGWTLSGHDPATGSTTRLVMTMTNDAVLTWHWQTSFWLEAEADSYGEVSTGACWRAAGSTIRIEARAKPHYHFSKWDGDATGSATPLELVMDAPKTLKARFAENLAAHNTPEWWLARHYPQADDFDEAALSDTDGDGYPAWQEWVAGTDPTNGLCYLKFCPNHADELTFMARTGRQYSIFYKTSLQDSGWNVFTNSIPGKGQMVVVTNTMPSAYFRLRVDRD